jgi:hypothetical protein
MSTPSAVSLERLRARAAAERPGWAYYALWADLPVLLLWAWEGAEIRPVDLLRDSGDIGTYASDFFRRSAWRSRGFWRWRYTPWRRSPSCLRGD